MQQIRPRESGIAAELAAATAKGGPSEPWKRERESLNY